MLKVFQYTTIAVLSLFLVLTDAAQDNGIFETTSF